MFRKMASQTYSLTSRIPLNNGLSMPHIHLGVYLTSGRETSTAVRHALEAGYRAFDSAQMYHNEREVGSTILDYLQKHPDLKRGDIHYTSKLASNSSYDVVRKSIKKSVQECGLGYIDLFLLHSPYGGPKARLDSWKALEDAVDDGEVKVPGVSNYGEKHVSMRHAAARRGGPDKDIRLPSSWSRIRESSQRSTRSKSTRSTPAQNSLSTAKTMISS